MLFGETSISFAHDQCVFAARPVGVNLEGAGADTAQRLAIRTEHRMHTVWPLLNQRGPSLGDEARWIARSRRCQEELQVQILLCRLETESLQRQRAEMDRFAK